MQVPGGLDATEQVVKAVDVREQVGVFAGARPLRLARRDAVGAVRPEAGVVRHVPGRVHALEKAHELAGARADGPLRRGHRKEGGESASGA